MLSEPITKQHFSGYTTNDSSCHLFTHVYFGSKGPGESAKTMGCLSMQIHVDSQSYVLTHFVMVCRSKKKKANIRNRYNQAPHLTQETTRKSDKTQ